MKIIMKIALMILIAGALYNCGEFPLNCDVNDEACLMQEENNNNPDAINSNVDGNIEQSEPVIKSNLNRTLGSTRISIISSATESDTGGT